MWGSHSAYLALHEGIPFPPPMCDAPFDERGWPAPHEGGGLGLATGTQGGVWMSDDLPMTLHTFEYIARGALLNWWSSLATTTTPR